MGGVEEVNSLHGAETLTRRGFIQAGIGCGFATAAAPILAQQAITDFTTFALHFVSPSAKAKSRTSKPLNWASAAPAHLGEYDPALILTQQTKV